MRNRIIEAAMQKINQYGWRKLTLNDIAADLGISKKTVYKYFESKDEIIGTVVDKYMELEMSGVSKVLEAEGSWSSKLRGIFSVFSPEKPAWVTEELRRFYPHEWVKVENARKLRSIHFRELFVKARENGEIRDDISPEVIELTIGSFSNELYKFENYEVFKIGFKEAVEGFKIIIFEGILISKMHYEPLGIDRPHLVTLNQVHKLEQNEMRNRIIHAARAKINQYGFRKFTVGDISAELGISKKTIYKYFESKDEIVSAVVDSNVELEKAGVLKALEIEGSWSSKLQALMFTFVPERPVWVTEEIERFFPQEWMKIQAMRRWRFPIISELLIKAREDGEVRTDVSPDVVLLTMGSLFRALVNSSNLDRIDMTYNQAVVEFNKILYTGILTKEGYDRKQ